MNKIAKKLFGFVLAAAMTVTALSPAAVQAAETTPYVEADQTIYRTRSTSTTTNSIYVGNLTKSQTIKKSSVKSSNTKVVKLRYLEKYVSDYSYKTQYYTEQSDHEYGHKSYGYYIGVELLKAGTSKVSFKIGDESYSTKITVKNYTNAIDTMKITGISSGKNIASKLKKQNNASLTLNKNVKNAAVTVKAKSGWKVTNVYVNSLEKVSEYSYHTEEQYGYYAYGDGKSSVSLKVGTLQGKKPYTIRVVLKNTSNGGEMSCYYYINQN